MTPNRRTLLVVVLVALVAVLLWLRSRPAPGVAAPPPISKSALKPQPPVNDETKAKSPDAAAPRPPPIPPTQKPSPKLQHTFQALNHNSIDFYGRAIDQFGEPVAGAEVSGVVLYNTGIRAGEKQVKTTTDAQGCFRFADLEGQDLGIGIAKEGYEYRNRNSSFSYSYFEADHKRHIPDPKNPVIFTLWKKQGAEALVHYDKVWRFPVNTGPVRINLATGKMGDQDADLIVTVSRTPLRMRYGEGGFAWETTIEVVGGGLFAQASATITTKLLYRATNHVLNMRKPHKACATLRKDASNGLGPKLSKTLFLSPAVTEKTLHESIFAYGQTLIDKKVTTKR